MELCSLNEREFGGREAEWHAILERSMIACTELSNGYELSISGNAAVIAEIMRLTALEDRCCGWMKIDLARGEPASLKITSSVDGGKEVIKLLLPAS